MKRINDAVGNPPAILPATAEFAVPVGAREPCRGPVDGFRDVGKGPGSTEGEFIDWLTMKDNAAGVVADVRRIRNHPLIPKSIPIYGYIYDVRTGKLEEIRAATAAGKAM
jgi:hypothetical protein